MFMIGLKVIVTQGLAMGRVCYQSVRLICTIENGSEPLKKNIYFSINPTKKNSMFFLIVPSNRLYQGDNFFFLTLGLSVVSIRRY